MSSKVFELTISYSDTDKLTVNVSGPINESARFPDLKSEGQISINLSAVTGLNSVGIRAWCMWINKVRAPAELILMGCPVIMVKNFNSIQGFLSDRCKIFSFAVPYFSEATGERRQVMATWGTHFGPRGIIGLPEMVDSKGNLMEMDVIEESYFKFLKR